MASRRPPARPARARSAGPARPGSPSAPCGSCAATCRCPGAASSPGPRRWWPTGARAGPGGAGRRAATRRRRSRRRRAPGRRRARSGTPPSRLRRRSPRPGMLVQFEDVGHRPFEEGPVVRDDDHAAGPPGHDVLQPGQAVEVEVVRRLVEEGEVEAGEQNGGEGHLGLLAAGQRRHRLRRDVGRERHLRARADEAGLEVPGRDRFVALERGRVALLGLALRLSARPEAAAGELRLHGGHPGASGQGAPRPSRHRRGVLLARYPTVAAGGSTRTSPAVGTSRPARICSRVDLPTPFGPTTPRQVAGPDGEATRRRARRGPPRSWCRWRATSVACGVAAEGEGMGSSGTGENDGRRWTGRSVLRPSDASSSTSRSTVYRRTPVGRRRRR